MKKSFFLATLISVNSLQAAPNYVPIGPNLGYGDSSNSHTIYNGLSNPAYNALDESEYFTDRSFGLGVNVQLMVELSGVEGINNYFDDQIVDVSKNVTNANAVDKINLLGQNLNTFFS